MILKVLVSSLLLLPTRGEQPWCDTNKLCKVDTDKGSSAAMCNANCDGYKSQDFYCQKYKYEPADKMKECKFCLCPKEFDGKKFCQQEKCWIEKPNPPQGAVWGGLSCKTRCRKREGRKYKCIEELFARGKNPRNNKCYLCICPKPGVQCDPLFTGLRGQIFKFDGQNDAWYANIAAKQLQWNIQFGQFSTCPKDRNMFVTATSMLFYDNDLFKKTRPSHSIVIKTGSKNEYSPGCAYGENLCLANGSLVIEIDGHRVTAPGDYSFTNGYGRVVAHNNYGACSHKWYDYQENKDETDNHEGHGRKLQLRKRPIDYLIDNQENMLNPKECSHWLKKRIQNDDLFDQKGDWATIHIETPLVSFHVEYRKNMNKDCVSHSIDAWITRTASELEEQKWYGILGETAEPKFNSDGDEVIYDREKLLSAKDDEAYEVDGAFGTEFKAQENSWL